MCGGEFFGFWYELVGVVDSIVLISSVHLFGQIWLLADQWKVVLKAVWRLMFNSLLYLLGVVGGLKGGETDFFDPLYPLPEMFEQSRLLR